MSICPSATDPLAVRPISCPNSIRLGRSLELLWSLAWRDVRVRYKHSVLGIGWAVLLPLSMMLVFTFVFTRAIDARSALNVDMPYALYAFVGLAPWTFFASSLNGCVNSLVANRNLVTKVYFPREVFPLSCVAASFVDFGIALAVLAGLMLYFDRTGDWQFVFHPTVALLPVIIIVQAAFTMGLGMLAAMANLFYRDVRQIVTIGIQLWMFVSGVVVPVPTDGSWLSLIISANPMLPLISAYRDCIVYGDLPDAASTAYAVLISAVTLIFGWTLFRRASYRFAECI